MGGGEAPSSVDLVMSVCELIHPTDSSGYILRYARHVGERILTVRKASVQEAHRVAGGHPKRELRRLDGWTSGKSLVGHPTPQRRRTPLTVDLIPHPMLRVVLRYRGPDRPIPGFGPSVGIP